MSRRRTMDQDSHETTRQRIVDAASHVFAEVGFEHATIRQIVERAGANIAAVNYHFKGKHELYSVVLKRLMSMRQDVHPLDLGVGPRASGRRRLHAFVNGLLRRMLLDDQRSPLGKLMAREMIEPTHAMDELIRDVMKPVQILLEQIVEQIVGGELTPQQRFYAQSSVLGQIVFHKHCREVVNRVFSPGGLTGGQVDELATHIAGFSYAGLKQMCRTYPGKRGVA